ncbi:pyridoxamine 5-phosphate oxidase, partial [Campylobacter coli]
QRKDIIKKLEENNIEYRPIATGDFTQNEVMKYFDYEIFGELQNAKIVHKNGFFVGNHQFDIGEQIDLFSKVMNKL